PRLVDEGDRADTLGGERAQELARLVRETTAVVDVAGEVNEGDGHLSVLFRVVALCARVERAVCRDGYERACARERAAEEHAKERGGHERRARARVCVDVSVVESDESVYALHE